MVFTIHIARKGMVSGFSDSARIAFIPETIMRIDVEGLGACLGCFVSRRHRKLELTTETTTIAPPRPTGYGVSARKRGMLSQAQAKRLVESSATPCRPSSRAVKRQTWPISDVRMPAEPSVARLLATQCGYLVDNYVALH